MGVTSLRAIAAALTLAAPQRRNRSDLREICTPRSVS
jgi:hypothetical protein